MHPDWRWRGLGRAMMAHSERQLRELAERETFDGPRKLVTWLDDPNLGGLELARQRGYRRSASITT